MSMIDRTLRKWALHLAERGWHVFPLAPGEKTPACSQWEQKATTDPARIERWWRDGNYNIGLACGPSGLVVVDLDVPKMDEPVPDRCRTLGISAGVDMLAHLERTVGKPLPDTYTVHTPTGGEHRYFQQPDDVQLRNSAGLLGWKVDTRGHGGYVVAPGSITPRGGYELADDTDPAKLPGWLHQPLVPTPTAEHSAPREIPSERRSGYALAALRGEWRRVRRAPMTQHNRSLACAAFALGQLVGAGVVSESDARYALTDAATPRVALDCDCDANEIARVIDVSLRAGARHPRRVVAEAPAPSQENAA